MKLEFYNKVVLVVFTSLFLFTSCDDDFVTTEPGASILTSDAVIDEATLESAVLGAYSNMQSSATFGGGFFSNQALLSDNGYVSVSNSNRLTDVNNYTHALPENGTIGGVWNSLYGAILDMNNVLSFQGSIPDEDAVAGTPDNRFGEVYIARAMCLFQLVNWYARPPQSGLDQNLGVVVPTVVDIGGSLPRSTVEQTYNRIISDLESAITLMDTEPGSNRFGPTAARLLLSRVYLYLGDYVNARLYAEQVLNNSDGFSLMSAGEVVSYYSSETSPETIFQIEFNTNDNPGSNNAFAATWTLTGTYKQNFATRGFYDLIPSTDARKGLYTDNIPASYTDPVIGVDVRKFVTLDRDLPYLRMSEAKLNQIEALYFIDQNMARTELNNWVSGFRDSSYNTNASGQALLDEILEQRRIEFAFEGQYLFDLNRYEATIVKDGNCLINCNIPFSDFKRVFPIPLGEIQTNTTPGFQQNPNY